MKTAVFPNTSGITACLYTQRPSAGHSKIYNYHLIQKKKNAHSNKFPFYNNSLPIFSFFILQTYIISMSLWIYSALCLFFSVLSIPPSSSLLLHLFPPLTGTLSFQATLIVSFLALLYFCYLSYRPVKKRRKRNVFSLMPVKV